MAIWSLTQERVERLMKQIGDKEDEIDALIKLTPRDLWNIDLEAFVDEWNVQLVEEAERTKKIQRMGRRASHKLGIGASKGGKAKKKRKMGDSDSDDDSGSDFGPVKKKAKPKKEGLLSYLRESDPPTKKASLVESKVSTFGSTAPQKQSSLLSHLTKADMKKESPPQTDGPSSPAEPEPAPKPAPAAKPRGRPAAAKKRTPVISDDDDDESDVFAVVAKEEAKKPAPASKTNGRAPRAATKPVSKYTMDSSSDDDDDDDLGDVSTMVKTIGGSANGVPMFKSSTRPGSSSGIPRVAKKASPSVIDIDEGDTTNYEALMPQASPKKPAPRNANDTMLTSDSEDDFSLVKSKPAVSKLTKIATKAKPAPAPKAPAAAVTKKSTVLSPAAKAYAARLEKASSASKAKAAPAKKPTVVDSDEEMDDADALANNILSDDDDEPTPKPKATSRAPAARPGRRAAAKPARYVVSDDDDEEEEASEASFDDDSE